MKLGWFLGLIAIAVFLAGCIQLPSRPETPTGIATGVIIKSLSAIPSEIYSGDSASFIYTIENVGGADAEDVQVRLFGLGGWSPATAVHPPISLLERPADKVVRGIVTDEFTSTSPPTKVDRVYTATIRVTYKYKTHAEGAIKLYNKTFLDGLPLEEMKKKRAERGIETFSTSEGPIEVKLLGAIKPLELRRAEERKSVTLVIKNIGQGGNYWETEGDRKIKINVFKIGDTECPGGVVALPRVGEKHVRCDFTLPPVADYTTLEVKLELEYRYFVDASTSIKVLRPS